jgi:hypothetical protein
MEDVTIGISVENFRIPIFQHTFPSFAQALPNKSDIRSSAVVECSTVKVGQRMLLAIRLHSLGGDSRLFFRAGVTFPMLQLRKPIGFQAAARLNDTSALEAIAHVQKGPEATLYENACTWPSIHASAVAAG